MNNFLKDILYFIWYHHLNPWGAKYLWCDFQPCTPHSTEKRDMGSPMVVLNNFLGLIWYHHSNPWSKLYLWLIFRPVPLQTTENRDMGSPMVVLNNFLGMIWHHHSNPWSKLYLWCDFQTCTPSDHREQGHGVPLGGPEQLLEADLIFSLNSLGKIIIVVWISDLYLFK